MITQADAITLDHVGKTYARGWRRDPKVALTDVSLTIAEGETFGFIGPNGAGKSTTMKILVGVLRQTTGTVALFGRDVGDPAARRGLGFVPENPSLQEYLTPYEILMTGLRLHKVKVDDERRHCMQWLERFELGSVAHSPVRGFSKGMAQRTALVHALSIRPRLLVLDEPLSGLDPIGRKDVVDVLDQYRRQGGTLFFSSHVLHDVERLADRYGLIHQGTLRAVRSPAELVQDQETLMVRTKGPQPIPGQHPESQDRWVMEVMRSELWAVLENLHRVDQSIVEIKPTLSLEAAFLEVVKAQ